MDSGAVVGCRTILDLVYSSSLGSTLLYPPVFNLRSVSADGALDSQLTFGDASYLEPDAHSSGRLVATLVKTSIRHLPIHDGRDTSKEHARAQRESRHRTGQVQVPSASPDDRQVVYLSDNGGHSNLWVVNTDGSDARQITFEEDPRVSIGAPLWAPAGNRIVFVLGRSGQVELWTGRLRRERSPSGRRQGLVSSAGRLTADGCTTTIPKTPTDTQNRDRHWRHGARAR